MLQFQNISIPFAAGVDAKSDPKQLEIGAAVELVNGEFDGVNRINKRHGHSKVADGLEIYRLAEARRGVLGIGSISEAVSGGVVNAERVRGVETVSNTGLMKCTRQEFGTLETESDRYWGVTVGGVSTANGVSYVVFIGNRAEMYWRRNGQNAYVGALDISSASDYWWVGAWPSSTGFGDVTFGVVYGEGKFLYVRQLNVSTESLGAPTLITGRVHDGASGNSLFACLSGPYSGDRTQRLVAWIQESLQPSLQWDEFASFGLITDSSVAVTPTPSVGTQADNENDEPLSCAICQDADGVIYTVMAYRKSQSVRIYCELQYDVMDYLTVAVDTVFLPQGLGSEALGSIFGTDRFMEVQLAVIPDPTAPRKAIVFVAENREGKVSYFTIESPSTGSPVLTKGPVVDLASDVHNPKNAGVAWKLYGQPFSRGTEVYVPLLEISRRNSAGFAESDTETDSDAIESRRCYLLELGWNDAERKSKVVSVPIPDLLPVDYPTQRNSPYWIPQPLALLSNFNGTDKENGVFYWPTPAFKDLGKTGTGGALSLIVNEHVFDEINGHVLMSDGPTLLGDAAGHIYDGRDLRLNSIPTAPLALNRTLLKVLTADDSYAAIYTYTDATGRVHRGAPVFWSTYTIDTPTEVLGFDANVVPELYDVELYKITTNGTIYYFIAKKSSKVVNGNTVHARFAPGLPASLGFAQNQLGIDAADADIVKNAVLYTTAEVASGQPPPADATVFRFSNRVAVAARGGQLWISKPIIPGVAAEFSPSLVFSAPNADQFVAAAELDGNVILWSEDRIYRMTGQGLAANGAGPGYQIIELASEDGARQGSPVALTANGIYYVSRQGPSRLTRGLERENIGFPIQPDFGDGGAAGITTVPEKHLVRYYKGTRCWAYNYQLNKWSSYDVGATVFDAVRSNGYDYLLVAPSDSVLRQGDAGFYFTRDILVENPSSFDDDGVAYSLRWKSGWISPAGPQGYMKVRRFGILAERFSDHTLTVRLRYDYNDTVAQTITFDTSAGIASGDGYQFRSGKLIRMKCRAIQIEIESSGESSQELTLSNLTLNVAGLSGVSRLREDQTA